MHKQKIEVHRLKEQNIYSPESPHIYSILVLMMIDRVYQWTIDNELPQILHPMQKYCRQ